MTKQIGRLWGTRWLLLFAGLFIAGGCGDKSNAPQNNDKPKRIILLNNTESPFWDAARAGIKDAVAELKLSEAGYVAAMDDNSGGADGQIEKLRQYGTQADIVAVVISPIDANNAAVAEELQKLKDKGIVIGCFDSDLSEKYRKIREFYVGTDNIRGGEVLGTAAAQLRPTGGKYAQFVGKDSQQNAIERMNGFSKAVGDKFQEVGRAIDDEDRTRARDNVQNAIDKNADLTTLVGIWSYNAPAIVDVVTKLNKRDQFTIVTFDAEPDAIKFLGEKKIDAMVVQNPYNMGFFSVKYCFAKLKKDEATIKTMFPKLGEPGGDILDTGLKVVVPAADSPLKPAAFERYGEGVKFMVLPEFQAWLDKYNLKSS